MWLPLELHRAGLSVGVCLRVCAHTHGCMLLVHVCAVVCVPECTIQQFPLIETFPVEGRRGAHDTWEVIRPCESRQAMTWAFMRPLLQSYGRSKQLLWRRLTRVLSDLQSFLQVVRKAPGL